MAKFGTDIDDRSRLKLAVSYLRRKCGIDVGEIGSADELVQELARHIKSKQGNSPAEEPALLSGLSGPSREQEHYARRLTSGARSSRRRLSTRRRPSRTITDRYADRLTTRG